MSPFESARGPATLASTEEGAPPSPPPQRHSGGSRRISEQLSMRDQLLANRYAAATVADASSPRRPSGELSPELSKAGGGSQFDSASSDLGKVALRVLATGELSPEQSSPPRLSEGSPDGSSPREVSPTTEVLPQGRRSDGSPSGEPTPSSETSACSRPVS